MKILKQKPRDLDLELEHPEGEKDEEDEDDFQIKSPKSRIQSQVIIGDVAVSSTSSLPNCQEVMKNLLKDKNVKSYLDIHKKNKFFSGTALGVG